MNVINLKQVTNIHQTKNQKGSDELSTLMENFDFESYLKEMSEIVSENSETIKFKICPICGHNDCFVYYKTTKSFYCFGKNGQVGGTIIDFLIRTKDLDRKQAIEYFKYELCKLPKNILPELKATPITDLMSKELPPPFFCVENLIPQGLSIISAAPKSGKSWFSLDMGLSVANGQNFLNNKTNQCGVYYLDLEDSERRLRSRVKKLIFGSKAPKEFYYATNAITIEEDLIQILEKIIEEFSNIKLIIIDTLQKVRGNVNKNSNAYANDYADLGKLKQFADKNQLCLLVVHHLRKAQKKDDDVFAQISGTNGIFGAADTALVLKRSKINNYEAILHICGRDIEEDAISILFDNRTCKWISLGNAEEQEKKQVLREYNDNEIIMAVRKMLCTEYSWKGTIKELKKHLAEKYHCYLKKSESIIAKTLIRYRDLMLKEDGIDYIPAPKNGTNGKRIHYLQNGCLCHSTVQEMEDLDYLFS